MKKNLFYLLLLISSCQTKYEQTASKTDCEKFKTGTFFHTTQGDPTRYRIERSDSVQTEFIGKTGEYVNLKITWTSPCNYELTFLNQHILKVDSISNTAGFKKVKVEILDVRNDTCFVVADNGIHKLEGVVYIDRQ